MHLVLVRHLVLAFAILEGLHISVNPLSDLIFFHLFLVLSLLFSLDLTVKESLCLHLFPLPVFGLLLLPLSFLMCLLFGVMLHAVQVLLQLAITSYADSNGLLIEFLSVIHLILDKLYASLVYLSQLTGLVVFLLEYRGQHIVGLLRRTLVLLLLLVDLSAKLDLFLVRVQCAFLLFLLCGLVCSLLILQVLEYALESLSLLPLLLVSDVLGPIVVFYLLFAHESLLLKHPPNVIFLFLLLTLLLLFLRPDVLEVLEVSLPLFSLGLLVLIHLL